MSGDMKEISRLEFLNSDKKWILVEGIVYDVTNLMEDHPGGKKVLQLFCKTDATDTFNANHNPSDGPRKRLSSMIVGRIECGDDPSSVLLISKGAEKSKFYMDKNIPLIPQVRKMKDPSLYSEWIHKYSVPIAIEGGTRLFVSE